MWSPFGLSVCSQCGAPLDYTLEMSAPKYITREYDISELELTPGGVVLMREGDDFQSPMSKGAARRMFLNGDFSSADIDGVILPSDPEKGMVSWREPHQGKFYNQIRNAKKTKRQRLFYPGARRGGRKSLFRQVFSGVTGKSMSKEYIKEMEKYARE